jgi:small GTP-binding protein
MDPVTKSMKLIVLGESGVGKTNILLRFAQNTFSDDGQSTLGVAQMSKTVTIDNQEVSLKFWDTAGQERFRSIARSFYVKTDVAIIVFDLTKSQSAESIEFWVKEYQQYCPGSRIVILGNKQDLKSDEKDFAIDIATQLAAKYQCNFYQVSALTGWQVNESIIKEAEIALKDVKEPTKTLEKIEKTKGCC